ncbi:MAG: hypothetical protein V4674_04015 [Patescibacteria group bacterium]
MIYFDSTFWKQSGIFASIIVAVLVLVIYTGTFAQKKDPREAGIDRWAAEYSTDRYGGATPDSTIDLLATALEKGDLDLASKYFMPDKQMVMKSRFEEGKTHNTIDGFVSLLRGPKSGSEPFSGTYQFSIKVADDGIPFLIDLVKNPATNIWKVEEL